MTVEIHTGTRTLPSRDNPNPTHIVVIVIDGVRYTTDANSKEHAMRLAADAAKGLTILGVDP